MLSIFWREYPLVTLFYLLSFYLYFSLSLPIHSLPLSHPLSHSFLFRSLPLSLSPIHSLTLSLISPPSSISLSLSFAFLHTHILSPSPFSPSPSLFSLPPPRFLILLISHTHSLLPPSFSLSPSFLFRWDKKWDKLTRLFLLSLTLQLIEQYPIWHPICLRVTPMNPATIAPIQPDLEWPWKGWVAENAM